MEPGRSEEWCHIIYYCLIAVIVRFIWMFVSSLLCILYFSFPSFDLIVFLLLVLYLNVAIFPVAL